MWLLLLSNSSSDYGPNYATAVSANSNLIIAAGFLLGNTVQTYAQANPGIKFAITDDPAAAVGGYANEMGITYKSNQAGCLAGVLAAKEAQYRGHKVIGAVGGIKIPPVDIWIAGYKYCAQKAVPGTVVLVTYSGNFGSDPSACATLAQNEMAQNAQVIFQVAGGCGVAALQYAGNHGAWGIGVDSEEHNDAPNVLTSALKKTDVGIENVIAKAYNHQWIPHGNINLSLTNGGVGIGIIDPSVPKAWISLMNQYKSQIMNGSLKPPVVIH